MIEIFCFFRHRVHVGWDPGQGFQTSAQSREDLDPNIKMLLDKIGMPTNLGKKDKKLIYDIIDQHGGLEAVKNELSQPPPPPSRSPPQVPTATYNTGAKCFFLHQISLFIRFVLL